MINKLTLGALCFFLVLSCGSCSAGLFGFSMDTAEHVFKPVNHNKACFQLVGQSDWSCTD